MTGQIQAQAPRRRKVVTVRFKPHGQEFAYFTDDITIVSGDTVVVEVNNSIDLAVVCRTYGVSRGQRDRADKWIIQKVDIKSHEKRLKYYEERSRLLEQAEEIVAMDDELSRFQALAANNPALQQVLDQLSALESAPALPEGEPGE